jgi:hypothetical protein
MTTIICLIQSNHHFDDIINSNYHIQFININTSTHLFNNNLYLGCNTDCALIKAIHYVHTNLPYNYLMVVRKDITNLDLSVFDHCIDLADLTRGCHFIRKKYEGEPYYLVDKIDLRIKFHKKYILNHGDQLINIEDETYILKQ